MSLEFQKTRLPVSILVPTFLFLMVGVPMVVAALPVIGFESLWLKGVALSISPFTFSLSFILMAGLLSMPFKAAIIAGKFPRKITHLVYGPRRLYSLCWCAVFYFTPVYYACLSVPSLKKLMLRIFGYKGSLDITLAPDAWVRDLPLLKLEPEVYVANKSTLGTNICLANGSILVDSVTLKKRSMIGHLAMIAPGCVIGEKTEVGVGCAIGIRVNMDSGVRIGPSVTVNHGSILGKNVVVGTMSYVGLKTVVADGLKIPGGVSIPDGVELKTQEDVARYANYEVQTLQKEKERLQTLYSQRMESSLVTSI